MGLIQELIKEKERALKSYSRGLESKIHLLNKSWTVVDGESEYKRLIFKKNGQLYITVDGKVLESTWEYLPSIEALILKIGENKYLYHEIYLNHVALILKKDSSENQYIAMVNPEKLPDLNLFDYLKKFEFHFKINHGKNIPPNKNKSVFQKLLNYINGT